MARNQKHMLDLRQSRCKTLNGFIKQPSAILGNLCSRAINSGACYSGKESCSNVHEDGMGDVRVDDKSHVAAEIVTAASLQGEGLEKLFFLLIVQKILEGRDPKILRPLPVLIGYKEVDLLKLSQSVASLGGYQKVTATRLWSQISEVLGFGCGCGPGIKLVYVKYLKPLENEKLQANKVVKMFRPIVENVTSKLIGDEKHGHQGFGQELNSLDREPSETQLHNFLNPSERKKVARVQDLFKLKKISMHKKDREADYAFSRKGSSLCKLEKGKMQAVFKASSSTKRSINKLDLPLRRKKKPKNNEERIQVLMDDSCIDINSLTTEENSTLETKSDPLDIMDVFNWMKRIALNPGDCRKGQGPRGSKENDSWADDCRLLARRLRSCLWTRRYLELTHENTQPYQRNLVLHPSKLYDKFLQHNLALKGTNGQQLPLDSSYFQSRLQGTIRSSRLATDLCAYGYDRTSDVRYDRILRKRIPIGPDFQAEVPEHGCDIVPDSVVETKDVPIDEDSEFCDEDVSKWYEFLGAQVWPVSGENRVINEKRIGKGVPGNCSCPDSRSIDCFRLHIQHHREILKSELGTAFFSWGFNRMGESVSEQWTVKEEEMYKSLVAMNPASEGKDFWEELPATLPSKDLKDFISYYFNVFVLRRRAAQNRRNIKEIDSDDDESECYLF